MMAYSHGRHRHRYRTAIHRISRNKVAAGVCSGLAEHFDINVTLLRLSFFISFCMIAPIPLVLYIVCIFVMPSDRHLARTAFDPIVPPPIPRFESDAMAMDHLSRQFDQVEARIRGLEDHVTSREYILKRKFENL